MNARLTAEPARALPASGRNLSAMSSYGKRGAPSGGASSGGGPGSNQGKRGRFDGPDEDEGQFGEEMDMDYEEQEQLPPSEDGMDAGELELGEAGRNWERPPCTDWDPATQAIGDLLYDANAVSCCAGLFERGAGVRDRRGNLFVGQDLLIGQRQLGRKPLEFQTDWGTYLNF